MAKQKPVILIMAGGSGTRFWPYSRDKRPKQFIDILGKGESLIQATYRRFEKLTSYDRIYVATNNKYLKLVKEQLPKLDKSQIILEPLKKNTAPCIAFASGIIKQKFGDAVVIVSPSDHTIGEEGKFQKILQKGVDHIAQNPGLLTIGIKPTRPDTGYGYIQTKKSAGPVKEVIAFKEKPSQKKASEYLRSGNYLWNAGIFIWKNSAIQSELEKFQPGLMNNFRENSIPKLLQSGASLRKAFEASPEISIDYAVMEKAKNVFVIPGSFGWSDLGSWNAVYDLGKKDKNGNVILSNSVIGEIKDSIVIGGKEKLIVADGLKGFVVADFGNAILICKKDDEKTIKEFVKRIAKDKGKDFI